MMRQILSGQHKTGPWLGALKMQAGRAMFYLSFPQTPMIAVAATPQLQKWAPWLSFWWVMAGFVLYFVVIGMWLDYKLMLPSETAYNNRQVYKHENPYVRDMNQARRDIEEIKRDMATKTDIEKIKEGMVKKSDIKELIKALRSEVVN